MGENVLSISPNNINDFFRLLRDRSAPWDEPWWTLLSSAIRCETSYPRFRLRRRAINSAGHVSIDGQVIVTDEHAEIRWTSHIPSHVKKFVIVWCSFVWVACLAGFFFGHDAATGARHEIWMLLSGVLMTIIGAVIFAFNILLFGDQIVHLENHLRKIAAEAMCAKISDSQKSPR